MNERGFSAEHARQELREVSWDQVMDFLSQKAKQGETINVGRSDGSKSQGELYSIDRSTGLITVVFQDGEKIKYKKVDITTFLNWQGMTVHAPESSSKLPEIGDVREKIVSTGGLLALGALSTYATAKLEGLMYPNLLETYNGANTFLEDMVVFVAHHYEKNPTTTMLVGSCIAAIHIALEKRKAAQRRLH